MCLHVEAAWNLTCLLACARRSCHQRPSVQQRFSISGSKNRERLASTPCASSWYNQGKVCRPLPDLGSLLQKVSNLCPFRNVNRMFCPKGQTGISELDFRILKCLWRDIVVCAGTGFNQRTAFPRLRGIRQLKAATSKVGASLRSRADCCPSLSEDLLNHVPHAVPSGHQS